MFCQRGSNAPVDRAEGIILQLTGKETMLKQGFLEIRFIGRGVRTRKQYRAHTNIPSSTYNMKADHRTSMLSFIHSNPTIKNDDSLEWQNRTSKIDLVEHMLDLSLTKKLFR